MGAAVHRIEMPRIMEVYSNVLRNVGSYTEIAGIKKEDVAAFMLVHPPLL